MPRLVFAISGASGMPLAHQFLLHIHNIPHIEIHLLISQGAQCVMQKESPIALEKFTELAHKAYDTQDMAAGPASGSWQHDGMIICPCSMSTLASIAHGIGSNLIHRAADVTLKERRPLVIVPRETPLSSIHLQNMLFLSQNGASIMPFTPAFYTKKQNLEAMIQHFCGRLLDQLGIEHTLCQRWQNNE